MKREGYLRLKLCVHPIFDYADTHNSHFKIDYLHENKTVCNTFLAYSFGAQVELLTTLTHGKLFYFWKKTKKIDKSNKNLIWYFLHLYCTYVYVVVDFTDRWYNFHWLCTHNVSVAVGVSVKPAQSQTICFDFRKLMWCHDISKIFRKSTNG